VRRCLVAIETIKNNIITVTKSWLDAADELVTDDDA
jgi:hypothetical protein